MASSESGVVLRQVRAIFGAGAVAGLTDAELLERFASRRQDVAEMAFEALVMRHGPMVLAVCRSLLRDPHDAEDAFQATFLVLVRKARVVWVKDSLGGWLSSVAYRVAARSRAVTARRRQHERSAGQQDFAARSAGSEAELRAVLHEEIARLPETLREAVVLCHLEGRTHDEAAAELRWPVGTVHSRLVRGRDLLRRRLVRRGLAVTVVPELARAAVPCALVESTVQAATLVAAHGAVAAGSVSAATLALTEGVIQAMFLTKLKLTAVVVVGAGLLTSATYVAATTYQDAPAAGSGFGGAPAVQDAANTGRPRPPTRPAAPASNSSLPDGPAGTLGDAVDPARPPTASPHELEVRLKMGKRRLEMVKALVENATLGTTHLLDAEQTLDLVVAQIRAQRDDLEEQLELLKVRLDTKRAECEEVNARRELAAAGLARIQTMVERGAISQEELAKAKFDAVVGGAQRAVKEAEMREVKTRINQLQRRLDRLASLDLKSDVPQARAAAAVPPAVPSADAALRP